MTTRGTKLARWMHLLEALLGRRTGLTLRGIIDEVPGYSLAASDRDPETPEAQRAFQSLRRCFERDKDALRALGIPLEHTLNEDNESVYSLKRTDFYLPYLAVAEQEKRPARARGDEYGRLEVHTLTPDVLAAIVEGAQRAAEVGDPLLADAAHRALRTLALDLPVDALRAELGRNHAAPASSDPVVLELLDEGVARRQTLSLTYRGMQDTEPRVRTVEPLGLFLAGNTWYLAAREAGASEIRNFRVSRIAMVQRVGSGGDFAPAPGFDLTAHARSREAWELGDGEVLLVDVRFDGAHGRVQAAAGLGDVIDGDAGLRRYRVRRPDAFVRWVLALAPHARIVAPPVLGAALREAAGAARAHHAGATQ